MRQFNSKIQRIFSLLPFIFIIIGILLYFSYGKNVDPKQIFNLAPQNYFAAVIYLLGMYALKSLSIVFPIMALYASAGIIFPVYMAVIVNIIGTAVSLSIPYSIGYFSGNKLTNQIVDRYPKLRQISSFKQNNESLFIFLIRIVGIFPMDVVSIFMGSTGISYRRHLIISILAMLPDLLAVTFIGATISNPTSKEFILSCILKVIISIISIIVYRKHKKA
ncbi:VTT domain-containing protein [Proteiniborus sp. MB09-C3]|uniref:TVP38/TMEM64 family protein n=1 Tax=Proteiniborus sp. MB09-C3 TaxID=3050072 RepID=UPI0025538047|nr:VTT domain-containing protein [Proteiniborus sp. MB09-C3]WIV11869.1 VTT domain-containing protein [Proteiniborus sp. MB09-C3]